jgi:hypothetical protein
MCGFFPVSRESFDLLFTRPIAYRLYHLILNHARYGEGSTSIAGVEIGKGQWLRSLRKLASDLEYIGERGIIRTPSKSAIEENLALLEALKLVNSCRTRAGHLITLNDSAIQASSDSCRTPGGRLADNKEEGERKRKKKNKPCTTSSNGSITPFIPLAGGNTKKKTPPGYRLDTECFGEHVWLKPSEVEKLKAKFPNGEFEYLLDSLAKYHGINNKKFKQYSNHKSVIETWRSLAHQRGQLWNAERQEYLKPTAYEVKRQQISDLNRRLDNGNTSADSPVSLFDLVSIPKGRIAQ